MSVIQHPTGVRVICVREDLVAICDGDVAAAAVLDALDYRCSGPESAVVASTQQIARDTMSLCSPRTVRRKLISLQRRRFLTRVPTKNGQRQAYRLELAEIQVAITSWFPRANPGQLATVPLANHGQMATVPLANHGQMATVPLANPGQLATDLGQLAKVPRPIGPPSSSQAVDQQGDRSISAAEVRRIVEQTVLAVLHGQVGTDGPDRNPSTDQDTDFLRLHLGEFRKHGLQLTDELPKSVMRAGGAFGASLYQIGAYLVRLDKRFTKKPDLLHEVKDLAAYIVSCVRNHFRKESEQAQPAAAPPAPVPAPMPPGTERDSDFSRDLVRQAVANVKPMR